jgi:hypothetical protein
MKSKNSENILSYEYRVNAEFKSLRLRIKRLEDLLLGLQALDSGSIKDAVERLNKG